MQQLPNSTGLQQFVAVSRYARWVEEKGRRESWGETVDRWCAFFDEQTGKRFTAAFYERLRPAIFNLEVMPSMRSLMTAGEALSRENIASYNCAYIAINSKRKFAEALYVLMSGTGVGFSCERQEIQALPIVPKDLTACEDVIMVGDSKEGWAKAYRKFVSCLYDGDIPSVDYSLVRPAGARLKTFGGRASGPQPLRKLMEFTVATFKKAKGRKLNSLEVHDIMCVIGEIVVVGGVRRCLPGTSQVFTPTGPKAIADVVAGDTIVTGGVQAKVLDAGYSGVKDTMVIYHRFGRIECTPDHRVAVFNSIMQYEFKEARDIVVGDRLVWDTVGYEGQDQELPPAVANIHFNAKTEVVFPTKISLDLAWLFGLFHGDGCVEKKGLSVSGSMREICNLDRASTIFQQEFGIRGVCGSDGRAGVGARLRVNSMALRAWFFDHVKQPHKPLRVPSFIMNSPKRVRFAYLAGLLDADGRIRKDGGVDAACTIYREYAEDLVTLLAGLGIAAIDAFSSAARRRANGEKAKDFWNISIAGATNRRMFYEGCVFHSSKLKARTPNFDGFVDFSFPIRWAGTTQGYDPMGNISVSAMRYDLPLLPTRVTFVEDGRSTDTYDIEVDGIEQFTTDGLVVHNSALISLSNLSDLRMREAKTGQWYHENPQRALANNSVAYTEMPNVEIFMEEWLSLIRSKSGERGIFNRVAAQKQAARHGRRPAEVDYGSNPCLHPDSIIQTVHGAMRIADMTEPMGVYTMLADGSLGVAQASASWVTKRNAETYEVTVSSGQKVRCTPDHRIYVVGRGWKEARHLDIGDYVSHLSRARRGAAYSGVRLTTDPRGTRGTRMEHHVVWVGVNGPIPDGYDIHHIDGDTYNNDIDNLECMRHEDHARLTAYEQPNNHQMLDHTGRFVSYRWSKEGKKVIVPIPAELKSNLHQYARVVSVAAGETTDVYDITVEGTHNLIADYVVVHNCGEILLRDRQFCNLSEVVVRVEDNLESLLKKVETATIIGTIQSTLTDFHFIGEEWKTNTEEERLLGVSLTGIYDNEVMSGRAGTEVLIGYLKTLHEHATKVNAEWADKLGITPSAAITAVKPSGTVSQLVDSASGIHPRHSKFYLRTVRLDKKDPMYLFMQDMGVYCEDADGRGETTAVFYFAVKAPTGAVTRNEVSALEHLALWSIYQEYWCDHNPSITVTVQDKEWFSVGAWVYDNFDKVCGLSFLPHTDHMYVQAPYTELTEEEFNVWVAEHPEPVMDWSRLSEYEKEDQTVGSQTLACTGDSCSIL